MKNKDRAHYIAGEFGLKFGYTQGALHWLEERITIALDHAERRGSEKAAELAPPAAPRALDGTRSKQIPVDVAPAANRPLAESGGCRGSYAAGTACKACFQCNAEKSMLLRNYRLGYQTSQELRNIGIDPDDEKKAAVEWKL